MRPFIGTLGGGTLVVYRGCIYIYIYCRNMDLE